MSPQNLQTGGLGKKNSYHIYWCYPEKYFIINDRYHHRIKECKKVFPESGTKEASRHRN